MAAINCREIQYTLNDIYTDLGWDDYVYIFTQNKDWTDTDSVYVREASKKCLDLLPRFQRLNTKYTSMHLRAIRSDMPQLIKLVDYLDLATDKQTVSLLLEMGWSYALVWPTYGYGGALGILVFYTQHNEVPESQVETTYDKLSPLVLRLNAWARQTITKQFASVSLSPRETECMLMVSEGKTSKEIARFLNISKRTVEFHVQNAIRKLGGVSRTQAASRLALLNQHS
jgi:DNA-binding CsgD family transcriptional regulator